MKNVEKRVRKFPMVYMIANFTGRPVRSWNIELKEQRFKTHPRNQQDPKPNKRCCHESAGKTETFSSTASADSPTLDPIMLEDKLAARSCSGTVICGRFPKYPDILIARTWAPRGPRVSDA